LPLETLEGATNAKEADVGTKTDFTRPTEFHPLM
jgi:hypothetical protein